MTEFDNDSVDPPERTAPEHAPRQQAATGHAGVDEALARLDELGGLPVEEHPAVFGHVHQGLTAALGALDSGAPDAPGISGAHGTSAIPIAPGS